MPPRLGNVPMPIRVQGLEFRSKPHNFALNPTIFRRLARHGSPNHLSYKTIYNFLIVGTMTSHVILVYDCWLTNTAVLFPNSSDTMKNVFIGNF